MRDPSSPLIRVESAEEQYGYMISRFGDPDSWSVLSQELVTLPDGRECERVTIRVGPEESVTVGFVPVREEGLFESDRPADQPARLDLMMETATTFSRENPPHHPGTIARFPVPSASYADAVAIPMAIIAQDQGMRGLYAPPRVVVVGFDNAQVRGVGEFPGFDPESWPPERIGDWPPSAIAGISQARLQGTILRFGALWCRVLDAWFDGEGATPGILPEEILEALDLRLRLDVPGMQPSYERLNPGFARWLASSGVTRVR